MFYDKICGKLIVFDPLDRPIIERDDDGKEQDWGTKRDAFLQLINELTPVNGKNLTISLSDYNINIIESMIDRNKHTIVE